MDWRPCVPASCCSVEGWLQQEEEDQPAVQFSRSFEESWRRRWSRWPWQCQGSPEAWCVCPNAPVEGTWNPTSLLEDQKATNGSQQSSGHLLGDAGSGANITGARSFQTVDQTALSHVWEACRGKRQNTSLCVTATQPQRDREAYPQRPRWWRSLCPGCDSSSRDVSSSSRRRHKRCCWEALRSLVSPARCCVSVHHETVQVGHFLQGVWILIIPK